MPVDITSVPNMIGDNFTNYLFGHPLITALFFLGIILYFMLKLRISLDAAIPVFLLSVIVILWTSPVASIAKWIVTFIIAGLLYFMMRRVTQ